MTAIENIGSRRAFCACLFLMLGLAQPVHASRPDTLTLNLREPTRPETIELNEDNYWTETYNAAEPYKWLQFGMFCFSHMANQDEEGSGSMAYWDGFTYSQNGDNSDYGEGASSNSWVNHQWGCMAGGGVWTDEDGAIGWMDEEARVPFADPDCPYLVAYWGYQNGYSTCLEVTFADEEPHKVLGTFVCNHPWPYYGNINGDGFARPFDQEGDCFKLIAHAYNEYGEEMGETVELVLAEYADGELRQSDQWQWMDLTPLGSVTRIYFTMETTDEDPLYGPNTAVYFCLDKMQILIDGETEAPPRPSNLSAACGEDHILLTWDAVEGSPIDYVVRLNGQEAGVTAETEWIFERLQPATEYLLEVVARNEALESDPATIVAWTVDLTPPTTPAITAVVADVYQIAVEWDEAADNVGVERYTVYVDGVPVRRTSATRYNITGLEPATTYTIEVDARDAAGNVSDKAAASATTLPLTPVGIAAAETPHHPDRRSYDLQGRQVAVSPSPKSIIVTKGKKHLGTR